MSPNRRATLTCLFFSISNTTTANSGYPETKCSGLDKTATSQKNKRHGSDRLRALTAFQEDRSLVLLAPSPSISLVNAHIGPVINPGGWGGEQKNAIPPLSLPFSKIKDGRFINVPKV